MKNLRRRDDGRRHWHWDPRILDKVPSTEPPGWTHALLATADAVTIPTLLVRGGHSDIVDDAGVAELPQTEVYNVAEAGHVVAGVRNDAFNDGVVAFLERIGRGF